MPTVRRGFFSLRPVLTMLARMRALKAMADAVLVLDMNGTVVTANPAALRVFDRRRHGLVGASLAELLDGQVSALQACHDFDERRFEVRLEVGADDRWFDVLSSPLTVGKHKSGTLLVLRDMTERVRTEMSLRVSEEQFRGVFEQGSVGIAISDSDLRMLRVNQAYTTMMGYAQDEMLGLTVLDITAPADSDRTRSGLQRLTAGEIPGLRMEKQYLRKDGTVFWGQVSAALLRGGDGRPSGVVAMVQDISDLKRAEEALRIGRAQLEAAMDLADLVNWELDLRSDTFTFNDRFYTCYGTSVEKEGGYEMPVDVYARRFVHPEDEHLVADEVRRALDTDDPDYRAYIEHRIVRGDGEIRHIVVRYGITKDQQGRTIMTHGANQDVTELKQTEHALARVEEQLRQSQKMEAVGQLAGGIAHDFNNMLTAIIGNTDLTLGDMSPGDPNRKLVEDIREVGLRAAGLTRQILAFSRRQMLRPEVICLNDVVGRIRPLLQRTLGEHVEVQVVLAADLLFAEVDPHQMEQALMNLAVNGRDAMPEGGRLLIETANVELGRAGDFLPSELEPGRYVMLAVTDSGMGMDEKTRPRVFEPFFTTKQLGQGTGLGLSTAFGIVRQSGGSITVDSKVGEGSVFKIYVPACCPPEVVEDPGPSGGRDKTAGTETILVVEDESAVRDLVVRILGRSGYITLAAGSAAEVDDLMRGQQPEFDLLVTDVGLPGGRSGRDVATALRAGRPDLPVVFMSGYTQDQSVFNGSGRENDGFLSKPFEADRLLDLVRAALDAPSGG